MVQRVEIEAKDSQQGTALMRACRWGHLRVAKVTRQILSYLPIAQDNTLGAHFQKI